MIAKGVISFISFSCLQAAPVAMHVCAGINHEWDIDLYGRLLETGGGKERMTAYFTVGESHSHTSSHA